MSIQKTNVLFKPSGAVEDDPRLSISYELRTQHKLHRFPNGVPSYTPQQHLQWVVAGVGVACVSAVFSTYFPFVADPTLGEVSPLIYQRAAYHYKPDSLFDNSFLTYATDYLLAIAMAACAWSIGSFLGPDPFHNDGNGQTPQQNFQRKCLRQHIWRSRGMLLTYMVSVACGGVAHHFFTSVDSRNTLAFRLLWTVCVGTVAAVPLWQGAIASVWSRLDCSYALSETVIPESFWMAFAAVGTSIVVAGGWSYQRPACDTFVAGITQVPSTFTVMALISRGLATQPVGSRGWRTVASLLWLLNAPLLPLYPFLVSTELFSVGQINAILHGCLCIAWSSQALVLRGVAKAIAQGAQPPPSVLPIVPGNKKSL